MTNPELARGAAARAVAKELVRCAALLSEDVTDTNRLTLLNQELERARARAQILDQQLASMSAAAGALAQALAAVLPHVHTEDCPVCGRDFKEISKKPLRAHLSDRISELTQNAGRLRALSHEKATSASLVANLERERNLLQGRQISESTRNELKSRRARLDELNHQLADLAGEVQNGMGFIRDATTAARKLDELRGRDLRATTLRATVSNLAEKLSISIPIEQPIEKSMEALATAVQAQEQQLSAHQSTRRAALAEANQLKSLRQRQVQLQRNISARQSRIDGLIAAKAKADERINSARELARKAKDVRTAITRRVFNDSLNMIWRDLFVRLAPEEPFVPAFALPQASDRSVEAVLETIYRSKEKGGNPRAMLSAGNLNTAALTLFLALHLSVTAHLPWLIIDDPVQSMDEVHVSQFAALLRTLSKSHGRQIVLAMHERPLFEYLALELSPAYSNDRLNTIELGQAPDGATTLNYEPLVWRPDTAIAA